MANPVSNTQPAGLDFLVYAGDTFSRTFQFFSDDNQTVPLDIRTIAWAFQIKAKKLGDPLVSMVSPTDLVVSGVDHNQLTATKIIGIKGGNYFWDLEATMADGTVQTFMTGAFTVTQDVTNSSNEQ